MRGSRLSLIGGSLLDTILSVGGSFERQGEWNDAEGMGGVTGGRGWAQEAFEAQEASMQGNAAEGGSKDAEEGGGVTGGGAEEAEEEAAEEKEEAVAEEAEEEAAEEEEEAAEEEEEAAEEEEADAQAHPRSMLRLIFWFIQEAREAGRSAACESGTQFTCFPGTKVQILTQFFFLTSVGSADWRTVAACRWPTVELSGRLLKA